MRLPITVTCDVSKAGPGGFFIQLRDGRQSFGTAILRVVSKDKNFGGLRQQFPALNFDEKAVLFGAATHDLGKVLHPSELTGPGNLHERDGAALLEQYSVSPELARFARTHGAWNREALPLEDLLVALADTIWKGQRLEALEAQVVTMIAQQTGIERWEVFDKLDGLLEEVASRGDKRLSWQQCY